MVSFDEGEEEEEAGEEDTNSASEMGLVESGDDGSVGGSDFGENPLLDVDTVEIPDSQPDGPEPKVDCQPVDNSRPVLDEHDSEPDCTMECEEKADQVEEREEGDEEEEKEEDEEFRPEDEPVVNPNPNQL